MDGDALVPTLRVGTHVPTLCVASRHPENATRSVANLRSHAERGNEKDHLTT
jgi:hypothetical protein